MTAAKSTGDHVAAPTRRIIVAVAFGSIISTLDTTVVNVALNTLGHDLHSSVAAIQWTVTGYLLAMAAVLPASGWLARRFGARRLYIGSLLLFTSASALCALAGSAAELIGFRVLQGAGGGLIVPTGQLLAAQAAGPGNMGKVMSRVWATSSLASILGPAAGGLVLDGLGWHWIFLINVPVGAAAVVAAWWMLPSSRPAPVGAFDLRGLLLLCLAVPAALFALSEIGSAAVLTSFEVLAPLGAGIALLVAFAWHALRTESPLVDIRLYSLPSFAAGSLAAFWLGAAGFALLLLLPLYLQQVRHLSAALTGLLIAPQGLGLALGMMIAGNLPQRRAAGAQVAIVGMLVFMLGTLPFAFAGVATPYWLTSAALLLRGVGSGLAWVPAIAVAYGELRPPQLSHATPQLGVVMRFGNSFGSASAAVVLQYAILGSGLPRTLSRIAGAYDVAFWWAVATTVFAIVPFVMLVRSDRRRSIAAVDAAQPCEATPSRSQHAAD